MTEQVKQFNALVEQAIAKGLTQYKPVKRFADTATGEKRLKSITDALAAVEGGEAVEAAPTPEAEPTAEPKQEKESPKKAAAAKKRAAKKTPSKKVSSKGGDKNASEAEQILGARSSGTKKAKLLAYLLENKNKPIPQTKLVTVVYGSASKEAVGSFGNCIGGLIKTLNKTKYRIARDKDKEVTFALVTKPT